MTCNSRTRCKAFAFIMAALLACELLSSCASLVGVRRVELPLSRLQDGLERRFPLERHLLTMFDIELTRPQLALLSVSDRIALTMDARVGLPLIQKNWRGSVTVSGRLVLDAARDAILMNEVRIDRISFEGADQARQRQLAQVANGLTDKLMRDLPLYRFHQEDLHFAGVQFVPTQINTTPSALVVTFEPAK